MASGKETTLENDKLLERRRSSEINHINRIRDANAKRQYVPIWADLEEARGKLKSSKSLSKSSSTSSIKEKISHDACVPYRSDERFGSTSTEDKKMHLKVKGGSLENKLMSSQKKSISREKIAPSKSLNLQKSRLKKVHAQEDVSREFLGKPVKIVSKRRTSKYRKNKSNLNPKSFRNKTKNISKVLKKDQNVKKKLNKNEFSKSHALDSDLDLENLKYTALDDVASLKKTNKAPKILRKKQKLTKNLSEKKHLKQDSDHDSENSIDDMLVNVANSKKPVTTKEIIVLKWLHKMKCPEAGKSDASEESMNSKGDQKYPIEIIKRTSAIKDRIKSSDAISEKNIKSKSFEFHPSIEHVSLERIFPRSIYSENVILETRKSKELKQAESKYSSFNVEMRVTELGKLHIVLNLKSLSPEDSAIIIWLDDLPRSDMKPDFKKRLSISSIDNMQQQKRLSFLKSLSSQALEDEPSPKPNIYFPSVTILKNLAIDSKGKLRDFKVDPSDSIYYKRCNLTHSEELSPL